MADTKKIRFSRKRERICEWIRSREDHPRAEDIYAALRQEFPDLSLGTVYKNLHFLEEQGRISKVRGSLGTERFTSIRFPSLNGKHRSCRRSCRRTSRGDGGRRPY